MKILLTGFDAFGGENINPSFEAIKNIENYINGVEIIKQMIPTVRYKSFEMIKEIIDDNNDLSVIISFGQAGGRKSISLERVAINCDDYRISDNHGNKPIDEVINEDGANAYFSTLPLRKIQRELESNNIPVEISNTAGTFVCNHVFYSVRDYCEKYYPNIISGFIHVPYIKSQVKDDKTPYMELDDIIRAINLIIEVIIKERIG